jgi:hypothetical protein
VDRDTAISFATANPTATIAIPESDTFYLFNVDAVVIDNPIQDAEADGPIYTQADKPINVVRAHGGFIDVTLSPYGTYPSAIFVTMTDIAKTIESWGLKTFKRSRSQIKIADGDRQLKMGREFQGNKVNITILPKDDVPMIEFPWNQHRTIDIEKTIKYQGEEVVCNWSLNYRVGGASLIDQSDPLKLTGAVKPMLLCNMPWGCKNLTAVCGGCPPPSKKKSREEQEEAKQGKKQMKEEKAAKVSGTVEGWLNKVETECPFFNEGTCHRGLRCMFLHDGIKARDKGKVNNILCKVTRRKSGACVAGSSCCYVNHSDCGYRNLTPTSGR